MCTSKKLLFSTRTYRLRKWLESQYKATLYKSASSNSYYYFIATTIGIEFKIRISDHFSSDKKMGGADYNIIISFDPHDINKNVYNVTIRGFENNIISINDFRELKYDINRAIIFSKFFNDRQIASATHTANAANYTTQQQANDNSFAAAVTGNENSATGFGSNTREALKDMNAHNRTNNNAIWQYLCLAIPGWLTFDKQEHKAIKELFATKIDFEEGCKFVDENRNYPKAKFVLNLYKKRNEIEFNSKKAK